MPSVFQNMMNRKIDQSWIMIFPAIHQLITQVKYRGIIPEVFRISVFLISEKGIFAVNVFIFTEILTVFQSPEEEWINLINFFSKKILQDVQALFPAHRPSSGTPCHASVCSCFCLIKQPYTHHSLTVEGKDIVISVSHGPPH